VDELRILLVGFPQFEMGFSEGSRVISSVEVPLREDEAIKHVRIFPRTEGKSVVRTFDSNPTLYDYQIIVFHPSAITKETLNQNLLGKKEEVNSFLSHIEGFVVLPFVGDNELYSWLPDTLVQEVHGKSGERINFNYDHWLFPFVEDAKKHVSFSWKGHMDRTITELSPKEREDIIGINLLGSPVSWESKFGKGRVVFLPHFEFTGGNTRDGKKNAEAFTRKLVDTLREHLSSPQAQEIPEWVSKRKYLFKEELSIAQRIQELNERRSVCALARNVLWKRGYELTSAVEHILKKMGTAPNIRTDYTCDIEIAERGLHALVNVIDTKEGVDTDDMRHLLEWYVGKLNGDLKGILIVNHFRESEPVERDKALARARAKNPFSKEAAKLAKDNGFCLMTTMQLFEIFKDFSAGGMNKTDFLKLLKRTNGPLGGYKFKPLK